MSTDPQRYHRHRFPPEIISHAVWLYHRFDLSLTTLTAVRFCLAGVVVLIPTVLMGGTLPALARYVVRRKSKR